MGMQGLWGQPYTSQGISSVSPLQYAIGQPFQPIAQSLQFVPYQLQQLQVLQAQQQQQLQQLAQVVSIQLQQIQHVLQHIAQQIPSQTQQSSQSPWATLPQTLGAGYGFPFQPSALSGAFGQPGQVM